MKNYELPKIHSSHSVNGHNHHFVQIMIDNQPVGFKWEFETEEDADEYISGVLPVVREAFVSGHSLGVMQCVHRIAGGLLHGDDQ